MRSMDVGDGTIRAVDSTRGDREPATSMFEGDANLPSEIPPSEGTVEGIHLPNAEVGVGGPPVEVAGTMLLDETLSSRMADAPSSTKGRDKGVAEDGYETCSDIDYDEMRMLSEGLTRVEVRLEGSTRTIMVPMDRILLVNMEDVVPCLGLLCSDVECRTLEKLDDVALSMGIASLALSVNFSNLFNFRALYFIFISSFDFCFLPFSILLF